jgi:hypothetical protein
MELRGMIATLVAVSTGLVGVVAVPAPVAASPARTAPRASAVTVRTFATREGLVGGTTANGHVITERDHFVSLPSRRGLSPKGTGTYSLRVCAGGRCAYEPVWDVGPWNTRDDYWNPAREQWQGLAQGMPEAQAAYQSGYNGGRDQFGRKVLNPAGIDLADGTMWDGLGLSDNTWVTVSYLWTGSGTQARVATAGGALTVRSGPGTGSRAVGLAGPYARLPIECQAAGESIAGFTGTSNRWDRIGPGNYVSHAYVALDPGVTPPSC